MKILMRKSLAEEKEFEAASYYFDIVESRSKCHNELVIPRYSALPYFEELEKDLELNGCALIENFSGFNFIKNFEYYDWLGTYTPKTYFSLQEFIDKAPEKEYVLKGRTNSRKWFFNTKMYAQNKERAKSLYFELMSDSLLGEQGIIFREYIPLKTYEIGVNGTRFTNEWRVFCFRGKILTKGYYWSCASDSVIENAEFSHKAQELLDAVVPIISRFCVFPVIDIAETETGEWIAIEVNSGMMSGLSENSADLFYRRLRERILLLGD